MAHIFSNKEKEYVKKYWGQESAYSMKEKFGCRWEEVVDLAVSFGLEAPKSNRWTKEEVETLKQLSKTMHYEKIAKKMGKTSNAIYLKARKLGIVLIMDRREWTKEEEKKLKKLWGTCKIEKIAKEMKRTVFSLKVKAIRMGLGAMILNNTDIVLISDISEILNVSEDIIRNTWIKKGLKIDSVSVSNKKSYKGVTLENLMKFLKNNQEIWDSKNLEENSLGLEPKWLKEKRKTDKDKVYKTYSFWTEEEKSTARFLIQKRKSYEYIATKVNHTPSAVAIFLRNEGYVYLLSNFWSAKEIRFVRENMYHFTTEEIAVQLKRSINSIEYMKDILSYDIMSNEPHTWTEEEDEYLRKNYNKISNHEIANYLKISKDVLIERLNVLGILRKKHMWTEDEDFFIIENYGKITMKKIANHCHVSQYVLVSHLKAIGIYKKRSDYNWTEEDNNYIFSKYQKETMKEIAKRFDVSVDMLRKHLKELGIYRNSKDKNAEINETRKVLLYTLRSILEMRKEQEVNLVIKQ